MIFQVERDNAIGQKHRIEARHNGRTSHIDDSQDGLLLVDVIDNPLADLLSAIFDATLDLDFRGADVLIQ